MLRVFISNESGEPAAYCGDFGSPETIKAIGYFVQADLESAVEMGELDAPFTLILKEMTDAEVEALPDI